MRRGPALTWLLAILSVARSASAVAPPSGPTSAPSVASVTVTAPSPKRVPDLVQTFGRPYSGDRLSRWRGPVCPSVTGFAPDQNSFIAARIVQISKAAKQIEPFHACAPNIVVIAAPNDLTLRQQIGQQAQRLLSPQSRFPVDKLQLRASVMNDGVPVHVYYDSGEVAAFEGGPPIDEGNIAGSLADLSGALSAFNAPVVEHAVPSRLTPNVDDAFRRVVVVLDGRQLAGQIAAYVSMITLAEVRVEAPPGDVDTIVSLFADRKAGRAPPDDLTFWDRAYLGALYNAPTQINISFQRNVMANRIAHSIEVLNLPETPAIPTSTH